MSRSMNKAEALREMERLYLQHAYSDSEMAVRLGVDRSTAYRYRKELSSGENPLSIEQDENGRWKIDRATYLSSVRVNLYESLILYLATRRATQQGRLAGQHAANALEKIAVTLRQPMTERLVKAADKVLAENPFPEQVKIFETVARGWAEHIPVRIRYQALQARSPREHLIHPYVIEPSLWSDSVYVIAFSEQTGRIIPFKIERILRASLATGRFDAPEDFDEETLLEHAWGVWTREGEPVTVRLRFAAGTATRRLKESTWHPLETVTDTEDGGCIWEAPIAEWREMLPWVRGWGSQAEVLAPEGLRKALAREARRLAQVYGVGGQEGKSSPLYALWAKTNPTSGEYHPLLFHLVDVGECALALWQQALTPASRQDIANQLSLSEDEAGRLFAFLAATHDLGKASPAYQCKYPPDSEALQRLQTLGFTFPPRVCEKPVPHGMISAWTLRMLLPEVLGWQKYDAKRLAHAVGGHHGTWPSTLDVQNLDGKYRSHPGDGLWEKTRREIFENLLALYDPPQKIVLPDVPRQSALLAILSGLVTTADWLGSMDEFFDYEERPLPAQEYRQVAAQRAARALEATGWASAWQPSGETLSFADVFPFPPNEMQETVIQTALDAGQPALLILEAPTGQGKTEAALYLADAWLQQHGGRGLYIAMPTQATSNQMFERTLRFLEKRYPGERVNVHLAHGQARWHADMERLRLSAVGDAVEDGLRAEAWFLPRKRTLLAPFGVGTVDQALLGVLQTRHAFLRLFGLAHKVVIFDEVHAYDTYMEEIFLRLLAWLRAVGASVIVLSATLPADTRRKMVQAFGGSPQEDAAPYPRLTLTTPEGTQVHPLPAPPQRDIALEWLDRQPESIAAALHTRLQKGGCAAVICNTVKRAQQVYRALADDANFAATELLLFHARMPFAWRKEVEKKVLAKFGKPDEKSPHNRPQRAVVVATQVIEQSLDLDFDLMISDLAPIDLLIQRAGRLHRHPRGMRPPGLAHPHLLIAQPEGQINSPSFGSDAFVYEAYILWQTWRALDGRTSLHLPAETDALIQAVYGDLDPAHLSASLCDALQQAYGQMQKHFHDDSAKARNTLLPAPTDESLVTRPGRDLRDDEDPALHPQARARTRLIAPGAQILCLHRQPDGSLTLEPDGSGMSVALETEPHGKEVKKILHYALTVHDSRLVRLLADDSAPWRKNTALRYLYPLIFEDGVCRDFQADGLLLRLDRTLGFRIEKENL